MPAKESSTEKEKSVELFLGIGLDERTARNTVANNKVTANLTAVILEAGLTDGCNRTVGNLLYTVATKYPTNALVHRPTLVQYVVSLKIKTPAQLEAAFSFLSATGSEPFKLNEFEEACGVGVDVSAEETEKTVNDIFEENKESILAERYQTNVGDLFAHLRKRLPWADPKIVKELIQKKMIELLGERTAADDEKAAKKKKEKPTKVKEKSTVVASENPSEEDVNPFSIFPQPEENFK